MVRPRSLGPRPRLAWARVGAAQEGDGVLACTETETKGSEMKKQNIAVSFGTSDGKLLICYSCTRPISRGDDYFRFALQTTRFGPLCKRLCRSEARRIFQKAASNKEGVVFDIEAAAKEVELHWGLAKEE